MLFGSGHLLRPASGLNKIGCLVSLLGRKEGSYILIIINTRVIISMNAL